MTTVLLLFQLFKTFFLVGLFTFGGGYAMLSLIQTQVVTAHAWISESTFTDIVAISQMTPGPIGINTATYVGYEVLRNATDSCFWGVLGSFTATLALVLPSFILVLAMAKAYTKLRDNKMFDNMMRAIRPAVAGLIGAAAVILLVSTEWSGTPLLSQPHISVVRDNIIDWKSCALLGAALVASMGFKVNPILIIIAGGVAGFILY